MMKIRPADERGHVNYGWLDSHHTFSFDTYYDPNHMGFRSLRVINDDTVSPGQGFGTHGHRDMEILTYVLEGALAHKDSMGTGAVLQAGEVQRMTAGTGVTHSEFNHSGTDPVHFLQIWILPQTKGLSPSYEERVVPGDQKRGRLRLIASPDGRDDSLLIHQDVRVYATILKTGDRLEHRLEPGRAAWIQVARGRVKVNDETLGPGDGAAVTDEPALELEGDSESETVIFDLK